MCNATNGSIKSSSNSVSENPSKFSANGSSNSNGDTTASNNNNPNSSEKNGSSSKNGLHLDKDGKYNNITPSSSSSGNKNNAAAALPVLRGTLRYNTMGKRTHLLRGEWNYENVASSGSENQTPQRFEYRRFIAEEDDVTILPQDGEFFGEFSILIPSTNKEKKKQKKEREIIQEKGVKIQFIEKEDGKYEVNGKGSNRFGNFELFGTAEKNKNNDSEYEVVLKKRYITPTPGATAKSKKKGSKRKRPDNSNLTPGVPPPPAKSFPSNVVCMKGKVERTTALDGTQVISKIEGLWNSGLDKILEDPENEKGLSNKFEYNRDVTSGKFNGWFIVTSPDTSRATMSERNITFRFIKNSEGYFNVEGKGSNAYGKYEVTGNLKGDEVTVFRHFILSKRKAHKIPKTPKTSATPTDSTGIRHAPKLPMRQSGGSTSSKALSSGPKTPVFKLSDVKLPEIEDGELPKAVDPPGQGKYSVVSRGILKVTADGHHSCRGDWATSRELFDQGKHYKFSFGLKPSDAAIAADQDQKESEKNDSPDFMPTTTKFPLDSAHYYGNFHMQRGKAKVEDVQIVLKFRKNKAGTYNVHGMGVNEFGKYDLTGTLIPTGQICLYRIYHPQPDASLSNTSSGKQLLTPSELSSARPFKNNFAPRDSDSHDGEFSSLAVKASPVASNSIMPNSNSILPNSFMPHRSSSRQVKVPSRLEDGDPKFVQGKVMERCYELLRLMREKDVRGLFAEPVDPIACGVPSYPDIIKNPMDFSTISQKLHANEVDNHHDFAKLMRLVFENAITFNVGDDDPIGQSAKELLYLFNSKFKEIEKESDKLSSDKKSKGKGKGKKDSSKDSKKKAKDDQPKKKDSKPKSVSKGSKSNSGYVTRAEYNELHSSFVNLQTMFHAVVDQLEKSGIKIELPEPVVVPDVLPSAPAKKSTSKTPAAPKADVKLTTQELEALTEDIQELTSDEDITDGLFKILKQDENVNGDDGNIELEIDILSTLTQRKLQAFIKKHKPKSKVKPKPAKTTKAPKRKSSTANTGSRKKPPTKQPKVEEAAPAPPTPEPPTPTPQEEIVPPSNIFDINISESDTSDDESVQVEEKTENTTKAVAVETPAVATVPDDVYGGDDSDDSDSDVDNDVNPWNPFDPQAERDSDSDKDSDNEDDGHANAFDIAIQATKEKEKLAIKRENREKNATNLLEQQKKEEQAANAAKLQEIREQERKAEDERARQEEEKRKKEEEEKQKKKNEILAGKNSIVQNVDMDAHRKYDTYYQDEYGDANSGSSPGSDYEF